MRYLIILYLVSCVILSGDSLRSMALQKGLAPVPSDFETLISQVDDKENPISVEKVQLGKKLFFDKNLSLDRSIACAKCHNATHGGADGKATAIGYKNQENPKHLNSPTVFNTAYSKHFFWDGRAKSLREQASGPMQAHFEMASPLSLVVERVKENKEYEEYFLKAYGSKESINIDTITKAIAVYEKTLVTRGAFDVYLEGDDNAISASAKQGLELFIHLGCKACHFGPAVGGQRIQKFPLRDYNSIIGITSTYYNETKKRAVTDVNLNFEVHHPFPFENIGGFMGLDGTKKFRVPILRNISKTAPYFHNGAVKTLREAISIMAINQIGVKLTPTQLDNIEDFLKSLDGKLVDFGF